MTQHDKTKLVCGARPPLVGETGPINPPVVRASTVLYRDAAAQESIYRRRETGERVFTYGARGTPTLFALEEALTEIEGGNRTCLFPTGLAAIAHVLLAVLKPGDHALFSETIYGPARAIVTRHLATHGIACEFYPGGHEEVARRLRPETRLVALDNPGSIVFDIQDVPAIAGLLRGRDTLLAVDNTWGAAGLYKPLALGADISIVAITKYIAGHSDLMMGAVIANERSTETLWRHAVLFGQTVSPDDAYVALRGLRTARARLQMHAAHALEVVAWLERQPGVARVLYPALPGDPGYALWCRDFAGANGLLTIALEERVSQAQAERFLDALALFGIGSSWGGFASLVEAYPQGRVKGWRGGVLIRLHIGLEDPADLVADLGRGFAAMAVT
jgi:cystathionine beta-lyase